MKIFIGILLIFFGSHSEAQVSINNKAKDIEAKVIEWYRDIHENPELSNREFRTSGIVAKHLEKLGFDVQKNVAHTGVVGILRGIEDGPIRVYCEPDMNWWLARCEDLSDLNATDLSTMINTLRLLGNENAEFITTTGKGYRLDGSRHPHSWSILDAEDTANWIEKMCGNE